jgi:hypothetical protein
MTPSGMEPATFRFVAQYLNHCATISGPLMKNLKALQLRREIPGLLNKAVSNRHVSNVER